MCELTLKESTLLPHANPGLMGERDLAALREVNVSMGIMLETLSERLLGRGHAHDNAPDKVPARRLRTIGLAGKLGIPFTTGILIGIGETPRERVDALFAIRDLHERWGHVQEVIVQNFRAKHGIPMKDAPEPTLDELLRTLAVARLVLGPEMNIQAPPNLRPDVLRAPARRRAQRLGRRVARSRPITSTPRSPGRACARCARRPRARASPSASGWPSIRSSRRAPSSSTSACGPG